MSRRTAMLLMLALSGGAIRADSIQGGSGVIAINPLIHASVEIDYESFVVQVDPWSVGVANAKRADLILITDDPAHHLDPGAIDLLKKPDTVVVVPPSAREKYRSGTPLANGEVMTVKRVTVQSVAAYDLLPGEPSHPKGKGNGYVVTIGGKRLFFAGVTECVSEIEALTDIDVAFIPMNLPLGRMTPQATAACVRSFKPRVVYPYHYDQQWASRAADSSRPRPQQSREIADTILTLRRLLADTGIEVRQGNWYPAS